MDRFLVKNGAKKLRKGDDFEPMDSQPSTSEIETMSDDEIPEHALNSDQDVSPDLLETEDAINEQPGCSSTNRRTTPTAIKEPRGEIFRRFLFVMLTYLTTINQCL